MADGTSGLSLSEMGISTVKKTAQAVQKQATPFVQGVKQQLTGSQPVPPAPEPSNIPKQPSSQPPSEAIKSGVFDIFNQVGKQVTSSTPASQQSAIQQGQQNAQQIFSAKAAQPPDETGPKMSGTFDLKKKSEDKIHDNPYETLNDPQAKLGFSQFTNEPKETPEEKKARIESLRKQLHDAYYSEFKEKAEGKKDEEESVQDKLEREEQEEQQMQMLEEEKKNKMAPIVPAGVQGRQGAHEGLKQKG